VAGIQEAEVADGVQELVAVLNALNFGLDAKQDGLAIKEEMGFEPVAELVDGLLVGIAKWPGWSPGLFQSRWS